MDYTILNKNMIKIIETMKKEKKPLYFNEIAEKTRILSKNNLLKNLNIALKNKLLIKKVYKNSTYYCINKDNYILSILFVLIDETYISNLPFEIRKIIEELREKIEARYILIFGSYAKGEYNNKSDIDALIIGMKNKKEVKKVSENLSILYEKKIHFEFLEKLEKNNFGREILSYAIPIKNQINFYEDNKDDIFKILD